MLEKTAINIAKTEFASTEEEQFAVWCNSALRHGIIGAVKYQPASYELSAAAKCKDWVLKRGKVKEVTRHLLRGHSYTPDFRIMQTERMIEFKHGLLVPIGGTEFIIDVKGTFQMFDGQRSFSINQKWVYERYGIFVNKVIPKKFFKKTWVPDAIAFGKRGSRLKAFADCPLESEVFA